MGAQAIEREEATAAIVRGGCPHRGPRRARGLTEVVEQRGATAPPQVRPSQHSAREGEPQEEHKAAAARRLRREPQPTGAREGQGEEACRIERPCWWGGRLDSRQQPRERRGRAVE